MVADQLPELCINLVSFDKVAHRADDLIKLHSILEKVIMGRESTIFSIKY